MDGIFTKIIVILVEFEPIKHKSKKGKILSYIWTTIMPLSQTPIRGLFSRIILGVHHMIARQNSPSFPS